MIVVLKDSLTGNIVGIISLIIGIISLIITVKTMRSARRIERDIKEAEVKGYRSLKEVRRSGEKLQAGDKVYVSIMGKTLALFHKSLVLVWKPPSVYKPRLYHSPQRKHQHSYQKAKLDISLSSQPK